MQHEERALLGLRRFHISGKRREVGDGTAHREKPFR
jgi:hypothetical protein